MDVTVRMEVLTQHFMSSNEDLTVEDFNIKFRYTQRIMSPRAPPHGTTLNKDFLVAREILCACNEATASNWNSMQMRRMRMLLPSAQIPQDILRPIVIRMGECGRLMVDNARNDAELMGMNVNVRVTCVYPDDYFINMVEGQEPEDEEEEEDPVEAVMSSMERVRFGVNFDPNLSDQCTICLENFRRRGRPAKMVRTNCSHVFHEKCLREWLRQCPAGQPFSCPLCRSLFTVN